ncbi:hypothetical protein BGZ61DRAFT_376214 [Ilyonectria robusta]|uniref:uncharacterized protein n=1 Tax=Ilyonectria robusta TaxID=1079257 RepID=UPI001E8DB1FA|nr:uncharacterized protein BGZ61DRAFT_376214 [Ilyonectria robusta]KAH8648999.1 hypothetical protein BGZ61DRAFT_376214 [Ilyonectria robusta]
MSTDETSKGEGEGETQSQRLHRLLDAFLSKPDQDERVIHAVKSSLKMDLPFEKPRNLLPLDEAEIRRHHAIKIESHIRTYDPNFQINAVQLAIILLVPLSVLKRHGYLSHQTVTAIGLYDRLESIPSLTKHFLQKKWTNDEYTRLSKARQLNTTSSKKSSNKKSSSKRPRPSASSRLEDDDGEYLPNDQSRNKTEKKLCLERDGDACVVMGTSNPEACHIVPFAWNKSHTALRKTSMVYDYGRAFFDGEWLVTHEKHLANPNNPGSSDKAWNMICLNHQLHAWWSSARLGFKCLGITPSTKDQSKSTVNLQFYWMPRQDLKPTAKMTLEGDHNNFDAMADSATMFPQGGMPPVSGKLGASHIDAHIPILSGHLIDIQMPTADAALFKAMIDYQWALICVAALSGAAEAPELLPDHPGWGDPDLRTAEWVEAQEEFATVPPEPPAPEQQETLMGPEEKQEDLPLSFTTNLPFPHQAPGSKVLSTDTSPTKLSQRTEQAPAQGQAPKRSRLTENMPPDASRRG